MYDPLRKAGDRKELHRDFQKGHIQENGRHRRAISLGGMSFSNILINQLNIYSWIHSKDFIILVFEAVES